MTGGLPPPLSHPIPRSLPSFLLPSSLHPGAGHVLTSTPLASHHLFRARTRFCGVCTRAQFAALQHLARFPFLDRFTYWSLARLEDRLDRLRVDDGREGAGALCAMRYSVAGMAQEIIARRGGRHIGIADTEERMSLDSEGWDRWVDDEGQVGWVRRVLGPRGRKNATVAAGRAYDRARALEWEMEEERAGGTEVETETEATRQQSPREKRDKRKP
ncbi:hypothetical protein B0H67DRAFT_591328, partial [Lasiosphaeris hirsuta]